MNWIHPYRSSELLASSPFKWAISKNQGYKWYKQGKNIVNVNQSRQCCGKTKREKHTPPARLCQSQWFSCSLWRRELELCHVPMLYYVIFQCCGMSCANAGVYHVPMLWYVMYQWCGMSRTSDLVGNKCTCWCGTHLPMMGRNFNGLCQGVRNSLALTQGSPPTSSEGCLDVVCKKKNVI